MTTVETSELTSAHRSYLNESAITDSVLEAAGVTSTPAGIRFPYRSPDGAETVQFRPDEPKTDEAGRAIKYIWPKGQKLSLNTLRDPGEESPVLIVEGTKQALAVASWAPDTYAVYGMVGCWGWSGTDLSVFENRDVFIALDGDAATNSDVYAGGAGLGAALSDQEDARVKFIRLPVAGKAGADDWLASLPEDKRTARLVRLVVAAKNKPADRRPTHKAKPPSDTPLPDTDGRPGVAVNLDRLQVITRLREVLKDRLDTRTLYNYGGALTILNGHRTEPLDKDRFLLLLAENAACFHYTEATERKPASFTPAWPDVQTIGALMASAPEFSALDRVSRTPFIRPDGTVCAKDGYDEDTRTVVVLGDGMDRLSVPEEPTRADANRAASFLLDEWLSDMPLKTREDRANVLALVLTPFVRGSVPLVPMAVVSGLAAGSGKNLLVYCISVLTTGTVVSPMPLVDDEDEVRKQITSAFQGGPDLIALDEAPLIESKQLARALTSITYTDRVLGTSRMVEYANRVTWMAMGNQVRVNGDMSRRVYFIELHPEGDNPQDRDTSTFRHPDLLGWTAEHRSELVSAALTLVRAWYAAGSPQAPRGSSMGSFEAWDRIMSGILSYAGVHGFLESLSERRKESDFVTGYWSAHLVWLKKTFDRADFTTGQVRSKAVADTEFEAPPGKLPDIADRSWTRVLGQLYAQNKERWFSGLRLVKVGLGHASTNKWRVEEAEERDDMGPKIDVSEWTVPGPARTDVVKPVEGQMSLDETETGTVGFDLEGHDADALWSYPKDGTYVRLAGSVSEEGCRTTTPDMDAFVSGLNRAEAVYGHNILGFDIPALSVHHGADYDTLAARAWDTMTAERLLDPPSAKGMRAGYYGLDAVAQRYGYEGKSDDLKALARKHCPATVHALVSLNASVAQHIGIPQPLDALGQKDRKLTDTERFKAGLALIPKDHPDYVAYLHGDLKATKAVFDAQRARFAARPELDAYRVRETRVKAIQNRMTLNGWGVDESLLTTRVDAEETKRQGALQWLADEYGLPVTREVTTGRAGHKVTTHEPVVSPLATSAGREWLAGVYKRFEVPNPPKTEKGMLALGADVLKTVRDHARCPEGLREVLDHMAIVTGATAKYAEIQKYVVGGRVHAKIGEDQASGRWAMVKPSVTNLGKRGGKVVQRAVFSEIDCGLWHLAADFAQVDMRALAALSGDTAYAELFEPGRDAHSEIAALVGVTREEAKPIGHGWNYGRSVRAISSANGISLDVVERFDRGMRERFPRLVQWIDETRSWGASGELLDNGWGRPMKCDPQRAWTQAPALRGQGCARDIMCEGLLRMVDRIPGVLDMFRGVVHDEVVLAVPEDRLEDVATGLMDAMTFEFKGVPILADVSKPGRNWADCYSK